jgi:WD40 repeat protein
MTGNNTNSSFKKSNHKVHSLEKLQKKPIRRKSNKKAEYILKNQNLADDKTSENDIKISLDKPSQTEESISEPAPNPAVNPNTMETFGEPMNFKPRFDYKKTNENKSDTKEDFILVPGLSEEDKKIKKVEKETEKEPEVNKKKYDPANAKSENFLSFGNSVSTQRVYNNLDRMFTQLENSVLNPIILSALTIIESYGVLVTGGINDKILRFWRMKIKNNSYALNLKHEMKIFEKSITNIKYIKNRQLIIAGDRECLIMFDMTQFFENYEQKPIPIVKLNNVHWLRCMYHYQTDLDDWLITARNTQMFYYNFNIMEEITHKMYPEEFRKKIMCFEHINNEFMLVGSGSSLSFWDIRNGLHAGESRGDHEGLISSILYVKRKKRVMSGGDDGFIYLYLINPQEPSLKILQKISPSGSSAKSYIDSFVYFEEQSMLFCTNRTNNVTIFGFNRVNLLKEKSKIKNLKFKVTGLYFWKSRVSLVAYSSLVPQIIILGFADVKINS